MDHQRQDYNYYYDDRIMDDDNEHNIYHVHHHSHGEQHQQQQVPHYQQQQEQYSYDAYEQHQSATQDSKDFSPSWLYEQTTAWVDYLRGHYFAILMAILVVAYVQFKDPILQWFHFYFRPELTVLESLTVLFWQASDWWRAMVQRLVELLRRTTAAVPFPSVLRRRNIHIVGSSGSGAGSGKRRRRKRRGGGGGSNARSVDGGGTSSCDSSVASSTLPELEFAPLSSLQSSAAARDELLDRSAERTTSSSSVPLETVLAFDDASLEAENRRRHVRAARLNAGQGGSAAAAAPFSELPCESNGRLHVRNNPAASVSTATTVMSPAPLEPAFLKESDYPSGWMVYHPVLGVVIKTEADKYDRDQREKQRQKLTAILVTQEEQKDEKHCERGPTAAKTKGPNETISTPTCTVENKQPENDHDESSNSSSTDNDTKLDENGPIVAAPSTRDAPHQRQQQQTSAAEFPVICSIAANG